MRRSIIIVAPVEFSMRYRCYVHFCPIFAAKAFPRSVTLTRSNQGQTGEMRNGHCGLAVIEEPVADFDASPCQPSVVISI